MAEVYAQPSIPDKKYFTIGEVSDLCRVKPHVLRYWEQEFPQLKPAKRRGNRRYYQHEDIELIRQIRQLLYFQGYTINGARAILGKQGAVQQPATAAAAAMVGTMANAVRQQRSTAAVTPPAPATSASKDADSGGDRTVMIKDMLQDLEALLGKLTEEA